MDIVMIIVLSLLFGVIIYSWISSVHGSRLDKAMQEERLLLQKRTQELDHNQKKLEEYAQNLYQQKKAIDNEITILSKSSEASISKKFAALMQKERELRWQEHNNNMDQFSIQEEKNALCTLRNQLQAQKEENDLHTTQIEHEANMLSEREELLRVKESNLKDKEARLEGAINECEQQRILYDQKAKEYERISHILYARIKDIPTLAKIYADIQFALNEKVPNYLMTKSRPSPKAAEIIHLSNREKHIMALQLKSLRYKCWLYESIVPYLSDLDEDDSIEKLDNIVTNREHQTSDDEDHNWLSPAEYRALPSVTKFQLALDRWWKRPKTKAEIGADYERYIGYKLEQDGWHITYNGIEKGLQDMGIDLIGKKGNDYITVQCKNWSSHKTIHEKHINQLFGTTVDFYLNQIDHEGSFSKFYSLIQKKRLRMFFITSTELSETARRVADTLGVLYVENEKFQPYPIIKCNINSKKEKIYHLPYDQQYDRTEIRASGEFYAMTVAEAEAAGFRRAKKHFYS